MSPTSYLTAPPRVISTERDIICRRSSVVNLQRESDRFIQRTVELLGQYL